jgi:hypothetical protein
VVHEEVVIHSRVNRNARLLPPMSKSFPVLMETVEVDYAMMIIISTFPFPKHERQSRSGNPLRAGGNCRM